MPGRQNGFAPVDFLDLAETDLARHFACWLNQLSKALAFVEFDQGDCAGNSAERHLRVNGGGLAAKLEPLAMPSAKRLLSTDLAIWGSVARVLCDLPCRLVFAG